MIGENMGGIEGGWMQPFSDPNEALWQWVDEPPQYIGYILEKNRPTDASLVNRMKTGLKNVADEILPVVTAQAYPQGSPRTLGQWWGDGTSQGTYAMPLIFQWLVSKEQKYLNAASALGDYTVGLNPLSISFMTGAGFNSVRDPLNHHSFEITRPAGLGCVPGIVVYGIANQQVLMCTGDTYPDPLSLGQERQFDHARCNITMCEYTFSQTMVPATLMYTFLAAGGTWDHTTDPYSGETAAKKSPPSNTGVSTPRLSVKIGITGKAVSVTLETPVSMTAPAYLELLTLAGRRITRIDLGELRAGTNRISANLGRTPATVGMVLCRLVCGGEELLLSTGHVR